MIPQRILLRGFLCYRDEQEISFDSAPLWMLAGTNGSGKSAVFDAVTFALFGGLAGTQALVNKDCDRLAVEFDFLLDNKLYQAHRTLNLKANGSAAGTQQVRAWQSDAQRWQVVPDTTSRAGFDAWVRDNIGLTYETFTSSVLLMQGKAEKLLSAAPRERGTRPREPGRIAHPPSGAPDGTSRRHWPIESVIIDEGFGCLDRQGRQVMIQELHNLKGQLRCILLVSHQEEFADAFPDGYRFELVDGSTVATRFQPG